MKTHQRKEVPTPPYGIAIILGVLLLAAIATGLFIWAIGPGETPRIGISQPNQSSAKLLPQGASNGR
jgi:hypothetical protein